MVKNLRICKVFSTFAAQSMKRNTIIFVVLVLLLGVLAVINACSGSVWISPWHFSSFTPMQEQILLHLRLPKMLTAILAGASLSVAGLMMQTLFRNPLAGPYILGVSSGASLGVALVTMVSSGIGYRVSGNW